MANNSGQAVQLDSGNRSKRYTIWGEIIWPALIISCIGLASVVFLISCARVSTLELQVRNLRRQIDQEISQQRQLSQQVAQLCNRTRLRQFAEEANMIFKPAGTDLVRLPTLPDHRGTASPPTPHIEAVASRPGSMGLRQSSDKHAVVAEAF